MERLKKLIEEKNITEFREELKSLNRIEFRNLYELCKICIEENADDFYSNLLQFGLRKDFFPDNNLEIFLRSSVVNERKGDSGKVFKAPVQLEFDTQVNFLLIFTHVIPENRLFSLLLRFIEKSIESSDERKKIAENYLKCSSDSRNTLRYFIENERIPSKNLFRREDINIDKAFELKQTFSSMERKVFIKNVLIPLLFSDSVDLKERISNFFLAIALYLPGLINYWKEKGNVSENIDSFKSDISLSIIKIVSEMAERKLDEIREFFSRSSLNI